jgi:hypothetical protein
MDTVHGGNLLLQAAAASNAAAVATCDATRCNAIEKTFYFAIIRGPQFRESAGRGVPPKYR